MSNNTISISIQVTDSGPATGQTEEKAATELCVARRNKGKDDAQREVAGPKRSGHTGGARQCRRRGRRGLRLGAVLLAWLVFIVAKVANLPFDTEGADLIALSTTGIVDRLV